VLIDSYRQFLFVKYQMFFVLSQIAFRERRSTLSYVAITTNLYLSCHHLSLSWYYIFYSRCN